MFVAEFEKVSMTQFEQDCKAILGAFDVSWYDDLTLPKRATQGSAGYDFICPMDITIKPNELVRIPSGIRARIDQGFVLNIYPRSSLGFKYQMMLANTTGIIDSDYYGAKNEGHILVAVCNRGEKTIELKKGDRFVQGIFLAYYCAKEEEVSSIREGGYGSSGK